MKRKNDQLEVGPDGELISVYRVGAPGYIFFPFVTIVGVSLLILGFVAGLVIQFQFDRYKPEAAVKALVVGCMAAYDTTNPASTDLFNSYYKGSAIAESVISCIKKVNIEGSDGTNYTTLDDSHLGLLLVGCLGNIVSSDHIESSEDKDKIFNCLVNNNVRFRIVGVKNELTPDPPSPYIPYYG